MRIVVTDHAVERYKNRRNAKEKKMPKDIELKKLIRNEVSKAMKNNRTSVKKPERFRLFNKKLKHKPDQRFVWTETEEICFVVKKDPDGKYVVVTTLTPTGISKINWREAL